MYILCVKNLKSFALLQIIYLSPHFSKVVHKGEEAFTKMCTYNIKTYILVLKTSSNFVVQTSVHNLENVNELQIWNQQLKLQLILSYIFLTATYITKYLQ